MTVTKKEMVFLMYPLDISVVLASLFENLHLILMWPSDSIYMYVYVYMCICVSLRFCSCVGLHSSNVHHSHH